MKTDFNQIQSIHIHIPIPLIRGRSPLFVLFCDFISALMKKNDKIFGVLVFVVVNENSLHFNELTHSVG